MRTLKMSRVNNDLINKMCKLVSQCYAFCMNKCEYQRGSASCFSCIFRDINKLHRAIKESEDSNGTNNDRGSKVDKSTTM